MYKFLSRVELLKWLPKNALVAVIGVGNSDFYKKILQNTIPQKLLIIDVGVFQADTKNSASQQKLRKLFLQEIKKNKVIIFNGSLVEVLARYPDNYFDWVYIDVLCSQEIVTEALKAIEAKIKSLGYICGDIKQELTGVVDEFCRERTWSRIALADKSCEDVEYQSYALERNLKLYTFYNQQFSLLKERFLKTLQDAYEVVCVSHEFDPKQALFGGYEGVLFKTTFIYNAIKENLGKIILVSDIDIQFFSKTRKFVLETIQNNDVVFQSHWFPNRKTINIGFMAIRCNERTLDLWEKVLSMVRMQHGGDQRAIMNLLGVWPKNGLGIFPEVKLKPQVTVKWALFPRKVWCFNNTKELDKIAPLDMILHHATFARTQAEKLAQMEQVALAAKQVKKMSWQRQQLKKITNGIKFNLYALKMYFYLKLKAIKWSVRGLIGVVKPLPFK